MRRELSMTFVLYTPDHAYRTTLYLNNKYFLDGRDPNSFANVA